MEYVATFFSHYDAILFTRMLEGAGCKAVMMPVPRRISSSCGTGVRFSYAQDVATLPQEGVECIYCFSDDVYTKVVDHT